MQEKIKEGLKQLEADGREYYHHPVEPEARRMKLGTSNRFAYNAQAIADEKEGVIVTCENTREENDVGQLVPMLEQAQQNMGTLGAGVTTLGDTGYSGGADLQAAQQKNFDVLAPPCNGGKDNPYAIQYFHHDANAKSVTCPRGAQLPYQGHTEKRGYKVERYRCRDRECPVRSQCSKAAKGRLIEIWPFHLATQQMRKRFKEDSIKEKWRRRGQIIELCFDHIKQHGAFRRWTVWGLEGVKTQWAMLCATSNLRVLYKHWLKKAPSSLKSGFCLPILPP